MHFGNLENYPAALFLSLCRRKMSAFLHPRRRALSVILSESSSFQSALSAFELYISDISKWMTDYVETELL